MAVVSITPPSDLSVVDECADWLELAALVADDGNASAGDLERIIRRGGVFDSARNEDDAIEAHVSAVLFSLSERASLVADHYPFMIVGTKVQKRDLYSDLFLAYLFCLCLSYFKRRHPSVAGVKPRLLFEEVSAAALEGYLGTADSLVFGTRRANTFSKAAFKDAVDALARMLGEGEGFSDQPTLSKKDDHVDVVAVKHFPDKFEGKIVVFGQCATGENWDSKLIELDPEAFCRQWMRAAVASTPALLKSFFVPFIVPKNRWRYACNYAGVLFERLRVARYAPCGSSIKNSHAQMQAWITACLV